MGPKWNIRIDIRMIRGLILEIDTELCILVFFFFRFKTSDRISQ